MAGLTLSVRRNIYNSNVAETAAFRPYYKLVIFVFLELKYWKRMLYGIKGISSLKKNLRQSPLYLSGSGGSESRALWLSAMSRVAVSGM